MELNDYPHFYLADDGRLCSTGQHCLWFPRVLYDALIRLGYDGDAPVYRCRLSKVHDLDMCEVSVTIPFDPPKPWSRSVIGSEPDTGVEMMAHIALTSLCEDRITATAALPIALLLIRNQENPVWQQCLEAVSDLKGPHFHAGMTSLARYTQYLFNLQHNTTRIGMQQRTCLTAYKESAIAATREIERLRRENAILRNGARPLLEQDRELQEVYRRLSNAEHGWNHTHMLLDITREEVETRTTGLYTLSTMWRCRMPRLRRGWRLSPTLSSGYWSFRCRCHPSLSTPRRSMSCRASMRTRSCRCRMRGDKKI
jgi:hypothetical protein